MPNASFTSSPYQPAATLLNQLWQQGNSTKKTSLKTLVFDSKTGQLKCSKTTYAQVCQVQKHLPTLQAVLEKHTTRNNQTIKNEGLLYVLLYELLLGPNQSIRGGGQLKRQLIKHEANLRKYLQQFQNEETIHHDNDDRLPRYIRVNTCQTTTRQVVTKLRSLLSHHELEMYLDAHVPDLLVVPPQATSLILDNSTHPNNDETDPKEGNWNPQTYIVLQDKSSCFPALCLMSLLSTKGNQEPFELIDACAAPGNKTTHLAALVTEFFKQLSSTKKKPNTTIHAFDRDEKRHELLQRRCQTLVGEDRIQTKQQDFLAVDPKDYPHVRGILLDPTCSGSGMRNKSHIMQQNQHHRETESDETERLQALSHFQYRALLHACSFPQVEYIVYSTCSIHKEENENVVHRVLSELSSSDWHVVPPPALAHWSRRGLVADKNVADKDDADVERHMIRVDPMQDETNGFFVCCLARTRPASLSKHDASVAQKRIEKQAKTLGLSVYKGQFVTSTTNKEKRQLSAELQSSKTPKKAQKSESKAKDNTKSTLDSKNNAMTKAQKNEKRQLSEGAESPQTSKKARTNQGDKKKDTTKSLDPKKDVEDKHMKKRAKRLEWKKKQREAKMKRLQVNPKQKE